MSAALAVLLALQFAAMHAPSRSAEGIEVVICGDGGLQTITLDLSDGTPSEQPAVPQGAKCPLCVVGAALIFEQPDQVLIPAEFRPVRYKLAARAPAHPARRCRTRAIRAPPLSI